MPALTRKTRTITLTLATLAATLMAPITATTASADTAGPYFLYEKNAGITGPCSPGGGVRLIGDPTYVGFGPTNYQYNSVYVTHIWVGDESIYVYEDHGFSDGKRWFACHNGAYVYRTYGTTAVGREAEQHWDCISDAGTCLYRGWTRGSWYNGWRH